MPSTSYINKGGNGDEVTFGAYSESSAADAESFGGGSQPLCVSRKSHFLGFGAPSKSLDVKCSVIARVATVDHSNMAIFEPSDINRNYNSLIPFLFD